VKDGSSSLEEELMKSHKDGERIAFLTAEEVLNKLQKLKECLQVFPVFWKTKTVTLSNYEEFESACEGLRGVCDTARRSIGKILSQDARESSVELVALFRARLDGVG